MITKIRLTTLSPRVPKADTDIPFVRVAATKKAKVLTSSVMTSAKKRAIGTLNVQGATSWEINLTCAAMTDVRCADFRIPTWITVYRQITTLLYPLTAWKTELSL